MYDVKGRWALITGAARGIGYLSAKFMAEQGCNLILHSRDLAHTEKVLAEVRSRGVAAEAVALGRKVVAFAVGGLPEACGGKATLIAPGDIAALAQALETAEPQPTSRKEPQP